MRLKRIQEFYVLGNKQQDFISRRFRKYMCYLDESLRELQTSEVKKLVKVSLLSLKKETMHY